MEKPGLHNKSRSHASIDVLKKMKKNFQVERSGSFVSIKYEKGTVKYVDRTFGGIKGAHLSNMVRRDVKKQIEVVPPEAIHHLNSPPTVYVNPIEADKVVGDYCYHVDIKNCYWETAFKLGIITKRTYLSGLRERKWKMGRNAAIGSLDKKTIVEYYEKGHLINTERMHMPPNCRWARLMVINKVDEIAQNGIRKVLKDRFVMFLTDCFIVKASGIVDICQYLKECGYEYTTSTVLIKEHNQVRKKVYWDKIDTLRDKKKGSRKILRIYNDSDKFIHYNNKSTITL